jgi:hypothetical protein
MQTRTTSTASHYERHPRATCRCHPSGLARLQTHRKVRIMPG